MHPITFFDTEVNPTTKKVEDFGAVKDSGATLHSNSLEEFIAFLKGSRFLCGHNILKHDLPFLWPHLPVEERRDLEFIDTLFLSALLFPSKPYHKLVKDDKLDSDDLNNPLNDSIQARNLFHDEVAAFSELDETIKNLLWLLLRNTKEFRSFFRWMAYEGEHLTAEPLIQEAFLHQICSHAPLQNLIEKKPIELAYALVLVQAITKSEAKFSLTPRWVLNTFPEVENTLRLLRNTPCIPGCAYCNERLNIHAALKEHFGFDGYRSYNGEPLQERAVQAAVNHKSLLAIFPTGGGKSLTFQVPALMSAENYKGLTVVISPLQSLMKDQVDNLERQNKTEAVTINGLLDPIERAKSIERIEDGSASILYISPEALRSKTIERLILGRKVERFVIDEAHCLSSWGHDFRVDYLYIATFIKSIQEQKNLSEAIPVSCFTATAKQAVIADICSYFKDNLGLDLEVFSSSATRTNLNYKVLHVDRKTEKYIKLRHLIDEKNGPIIIYVSRTKKARELAARLNRDGYQALVYHGKLDSKEKTANQNAFISGEVPIIVATSAFGMGVDKKDVGLVVHYDISDSLENYVQEAGRAGRDENLVADCFVLYNDEDLNKHFVLLNQTKITQNEIQQVWKAIQRLTRVRKSVSQSALEIARKAGWDARATEIETRVKTAIAALEKAGYVERGQNNPRVFASSIQTKNAQDAIVRIHGSSNMDEQQKVLAVRIIKKLFSTKSKNLATDEAPEARVDYISDVLGTSKHQVIQVINLLRAEGILADQKDLTAFINHDSRQKNAISILASFNQLEQFLMDKVSEEETDFNIKLINDEAETKGIKDSSPVKIRTLLNFWAIKNWIKRKPTKSINHLTIKSLQSNSELKSKQEQRYAVALFIAEYLNLQFESRKGKQNKEQENTLVEFSVQELKDAFEEDVFKSFGRIVSLEEVEDALLFLSRIEAIKLEGGFLVVYNQLTLNRLEDSKLKRYTQEDYSTMKHFYEGRVEQIHIVGEYARKMIEDYEAALQFVEDYFKMNYKLFLKKYFPGTKVDDLKLKMTPSKFKKIFGELSPTQLNIINESEATKMAVIAGPGSGKTKVLVHKMASLLLMEDVKHEQLLMLTFSRAAATEFKTRLLDLIGNVAHYIEIKTFHSYCFDLIGKVGTLEKSENLIPFVIEKIKNGDVEESYMTKAVLLVDEAQDMNATELELLYALMERNQEMRVILVGDDDQNIYEFRGSSAENLRKFITDKEAKKFELLDNYRSKANLVAFSNQWATGIQNRLKSQGIVANDPANGNIRIIQHNHTHFESAIVQTVLQTNDAGSIAILTKKNEDAWFINRLLQKNGLPSILIQEQKFIRLAQLHEVRSFLKMLTLPEGVFVISDDLWATAKDEFFNRFNTSKHYEVCKKLISTFEQTNNKKKFKTDFEIFIRESNYEDFIVEKGSEMVVSTMHKAKGREFDHVVIHLPDFDYSKEEAKRLLYVAMTRAKKSLTIHYNGNYLNGIHVNGLVRQQDNSTYEKPSEISLQPGFKDINLGRSSYFLNRILQTQAGQSIAFDQTCCRDAKQQELVSFSEKFLGELEQKFKDGYRVKSASVNALMYWWVKKEGREFLILFPELVLEKETNTQNKS